MRRSIVVVGLLLAALYVAALVVTVGPGHERVRPLYDGAVPPPSYRWVDPPDFYAAGNVRPEPLRTTIALGARGSEAAGIATPDGQFVVDLAPGAIAAHDRDRRVSVTVTPQVAREDGRLPSALRPDGNLYRLALRYEPSGARVTRFVAPASLVLEVPELAKGVFVRPGSGRAWSALAAETVEPQRLALSTSITTPGDFLAGTDLPALVTTHRSSGTSWALVALVAGGAAVVLLAVGALIARRRTRRRAG
jgi:hypothetical protein